MNGRHILSSGFSGEGKQALSFRVSGVCLSIHWAPGVSPGGLFCIQKGGSVTAGVPGRTFLSGLTFLSCSSTQKCRLRCLFGIRGCRSVVKGRLHGNKHRSVSYCRHS